MHRILLIAAVAQSHASTDSARPAKHRQGATSKTHTHNNDRNGNISTTTTNNNNNNTARFRHSWDTLPVFWFSANTTGPETAAEQALISKFPVAILAWQFETEFEPVHRHAEDKLLAQAKELEVTAPNTDVLIYTQGQLAVDWYESTRVLLPPPCGSDIDGNFSDFFLVNVSDGKPAVWPSPFCSGQAGAGDLNYDFGQEKVRDYFVNNVVMPLANGDNVKGIWFDDSDYLSCCDMCNGEPHGLQLTPCDLAAKQRLFDGTVAWKKTVATTLNGQDKVPIFSSINTWNETAPTPQNLRGCFRSEREVTQELLKGLSYGRFYEGWGASCAEIVQAQEEANAGIGVFINQFGRPPTEYDVAAFLMAAGDQSFFASSTCWTDPCTTWHPQFYDKPLGSPKGPGYVVDSQFNPTTWRREFEHVNVTLDCSAGTAHIEGWDSSPAPAPAPRPSGNWSSPIYCTSCQRNGAPLKQLPVPVPLSTCLLQCEQTEACTAVDFSFHQGDAGPGCQLFADCSVQWHEQGCTGDAWWTAYLLNTSTSGV